MNDKIYVYLSSLTGNTEKLAKGVLENLSRKNCSFSLHDNEFITSSGEIGELVILFFWCRRGNIDSASRVFLEHCKNKKIIAVGTMGGYPDSEYGSKVKDVVFQVISENNICMGVFLSQGKIDIQRTEYRKTLPPEHPHYLDEEGIRRHEESQKHPDQTDIERAGTFLEKKIMEYKAVSEVICVDREPCIKK
ncbi:flavodoxin [Lacrimispora amygdalina]|uniref:Flavodoxin n=1 Tax=Lacrimispora amygdalina TaxID=253257 RepID=A0ABQ5M2E7_9FIRM